MYHWLAALLTWLFFWGVTAAILVFDDRRAKAAAKRAGGVDFVDRRIRTYIVAAFFLGGFVLILYFWSSRKSALGAVLGVGALVATVTVTLIVSNVQSNIAFHLDHAATARARARGSSKELMATNAPMRPPASPTAWRCSRLAASRAV
jgi:hypothetical protein